jgi:hypothetical protein
MTDSTSADEQPKRQIAKRVVAEKRRYFVPEYGISVDAVDADDAVKKAKTKAKASKSEPVEQPEEEGDV